ncbi:hypothetical protein FRB90_007150 [Tulasnella sp. 427]|nr:hypothetical protein FRB90_007150 [Tulasnella sp. 427]
MAPAAALQTIAVQETSIVFNLLLHVLYGMYGLRMIGAGDPSGIGAMILRHAASAPLRAYGLAASQGMEDVCVASSKFTFQITLDAVSENDALRMGPIYLRRLFLLHLGVVETLKKLLALLPSLHEPKGPCTPLGQQKLAVAWREAVASILLQEAPQRTTSTDLIDVLGPLRSQTTCSRCWESCRQRTMEIIRQWETLKRTI